MSIGLLPPLVLLLLDEGLLFDFLLAESPHFFCFFLNITYNAVLAVLEIELALEMCIFIPDLDTPVFHVQIHFAQYLIPISFCSDCSIRIERYGVEDLSKCSFIEGLSQEICTSLVTAVLLALFVKL